MFVCVCATGEEECNVCVCVYVPQVRPRVLCVCACATGEAESNVRACATCLYMPRARHELANVGHAAEGAIQLPSHCVRIPTR